MAFAEKISNTVLPAYQFRVLLGLPGGFGFDEASFNKVNGLEANHGEVKYRSGVEGKTFRKAPGLTEYSDIVCERGYTTNPDAFASSTLVFEPVLGALGLSPILFRLFFASIEILGGPSGDDVLKRFILLKPYVKIWKLGELDANTNKLLIEKITIAHEGLAANPF